MQLNDDLNEDFTLNDRKLRKARELKKRAKEGSLLAELYDQKKHQTGPLVRKERKKQEGSIGEGLKCYLKSLFIPPLIVFPIALIVSLIIGANSPSSSGGWLSITREGVIIILTFIFTVLGSGAAITLTSLFFLIRLIRKGKGKSALTLALLFLLSAMLVFITIVILQQ